MTAAAVAPLAGGDPARYAAIAAGVAVVVGLLSLVAFAARLGFVADLLSRPILVGYLAGVAVTMIVGQLSKLTGAPVDGAGVPAELLSFLRHLGQAHLPTVVFGGVSLALLFPGQRFLPRFPTPLFVVLLATAVVGVFDLQRYGLSVVGAVPPGLPTPALPTLADLRHLVLPAVGILVVGYTDTVLTARAFADPRGRPIDANQELLATGVANIGTGLLRGFPISSSGSRTALALASGALAGVLARGACRRRGHPARRRLAAGPLAAFRRTELLLALAALAGVLVLNILYGVLLAVGLSVADMLRRVARPHDGVLGFVPGLAGMHDVDDYPQATTVPGLVVYRYDSPLFFANAENFHRRALAAVDGQREPVRWFVLNVRPDGAHRRRADLPDPSDGRRGVREVARRARRRLALAPSLATCDALALSKRGRDNVRASEVVHGAGRQLAEGRRRRSRWRLSGVAAIRRRGGWRSGGRPPRRIPRTVPARPRGR